jgi:hypothetical protein
MKSFLVSICLGIVLFALWGCGGNTGTGSPLIRTATVLTNPISLRTVNVINGSTLGSSVPLTANLRNIAYDSNGTLYGLGTDLNLYTVNTTTGTCTLVSAAPMALSSHNGGMAFIPNTNTILFVNQNNDYYKINAATGAIISQEADANISVFGLAYRPSDGKFYAYSQNDTIHKAADLPTSGVFTSVGSLGIDLSGGLGFAVDSGSGFGYLVCQDGLYLVNLDTGAGLTVNANADGEDIAFQN